ncbi:MAG TPA: polysaccharide pyruvyl transferase family protein [Miltoncostaea sp.]|nr:polysaccharide pyruvyl transferase family protein [Miltoncostaea sp.]
MSAANPPRQRIALYGLFGIDNFGCEATLEAMIAMMRRVRPDADLVCVCSVPERVTEDHGIPAEPIRMARFPRRWMRAIDKGLLRVPRTVANVAGTLVRARRADVLVICGGGMLEDYCDRPSGEPLSLFLWCLGARLARKRVAFVSVGAGPMINPASRRLLTWSVRLAHYRSYRDGRARDYMEGVGVDSRRDPVYPDVVFGLGGPSGAPAQANGNGHVTVGVSAMLYHGYFPAWVADGRPSDADDAVLTAYLGKLAEFVCRLLDEGHDVRLLTGQLNDRDAVDRLRAIVAATRGEDPGDRLVAEPITSADGLADQIARTDVVVATRYHNLVGALVQGKPAIAVDPTRKNGGLMTDLGLAHLCQDIDDLDVALLEAQFHEVVGERAPYAARLRDLNARIAERLADQERVLAAGVLRP